MDAKIETMTESLENTHILENTVTEAINDPELTPVLDVDILELEVALEAFRSSVISIGKTFVVKFPSNPGYKYVYICVCIYMYICIRICICIYIDIYI
jgi:hypothetical protein